MPLLIFFLLFGTILCAQTPFVHIEDIEIQGNKKTKDLVILGELDLAPLDSIPLSELLPRLEQNEKYLLNTTLFTQAKLHIAQWKGKAIRLRIEVQERWYIYPVPVFELADRNFNVWWTRHRRDIRRTNLGAWLLWRNPTGYNDLIKAVGQWGYLRKFELEYLFPPLGRKRHWGFDVNLLYSDNKELAYESIDNKLVFYRDFDNTNRQLRRFRAKASLIYRPTLYQRHLLNIEYRQLYISDTIALLNPDFLLDGQQRQRRFKLSYSFQIERRDIPAYPLKGYFFAARLEKAGLGIFKDINQLQGNLELAYHLQLHPRWTWSNSLKGQFNFIPGQLPYYRMWGLGYFEDFIRGFQYYVLDGQDYVFYQGDLNFKALDWDIPLFKKAPNPNMQQLPIKLHLRYHLDLGYVRDQYYYQKNPLVNRTLIGTGIGLDIIFYYYNIILQLEYSFNNIGDRGLYFRYKLNF